MFCLIPDDLTSIYLNIVFGNSSDFHFNGHKTINIILKNNAGGSGVCFCDTKVQMEHVSEYKHLF